MMSRTYILFIIILFANILRAQDVHFSQFNNSPLIVNPALTGLFFGDQRVNVNFKDQWRSIGKTYRTYAASYDQGILKNKMKGGYVGVGAQFYSDKAGDLNMGKTFFQLNASSILEMNRSQLLSVGIYTSYTQHSIDFTNSTWDQQYNGTNYNSNLPSNEGNLNTNSWGNVDVGIGVNWYYEQGTASMSSYDAFKINIGVSASHVNRSKLEYAISNTTVKETLDMKIIAHANSFIALKNTRTSFIPSFMFAIQGPSTEILSGLFYRLRLTEASKITGTIKEAAISLGGYYRFGDAIVPALEFEFDQYAIGISYDTNISSLTNSTNFKGGFEISIRFTNPSPFNYNRNSNNPMMRGK